MDLFGLVRIIWLPGEKRPAVLSSGQDTPPTAKPLDEQAQERSPAATTIPLREPPPVATVVGPASEVHVVRSLIGLADDLAELTGSDWTGESAARTLGLIQRRVDKALADSGVRVLSDEGPIDPARHEVVGAEPTSGDAAGGIAATVRRGYLRGDELIRPQQVIAYVTAERAADAEGAAHAEGGNDAEGNRPGQG
jgi:hypothetical protein